MPRLAIVAVKTIGRSPVPSWIPMAAVTVTRTKVAGANTMILKRWAKKAPAIKLTMESQIVT
jgi:hypothetical protein